MTRNALDVDFCIWLCLHHVTKLSSSYSKRELIQIVKIKMVRRHCTWYFIRLNTKSVISTKTKRISQKHFYAGRILTLEHHEIQRNQAEMMSWYKLDKRYFKLALILFLITPQN